MKKCNTVLAALLVAAIVIVSGADTVRADNFFSRLFGRAGSESADSTGKAKKSDLIVVLDAGHGGRDSGAAGHGLAEKNLNLKIAKYCKAELEKYQGVKVYMTRSNDTFVELERRVAIAAERRADIFVSLHINSASPSAFGAEVFYPNGNYRPSLSEKGRKLAGEIQKNLTRIGLHNRGTKTLDSMTGNRYPDGSLADYYAVIRGSKQSGFPGIIVEHAFISNESDAVRFLNSDSKLKKLGVADAKGIASCYGLTKSGEETEKLQPTEFTRVTAKSSNIASLKWEKIKGVSGYEIYRSASKKGTYKKIASVKKASSVTYKDKSVKEGKTYFYKVRPYKMSGDRKITAKFSTVQKVRLLKQPTIAVNGKVSGTNVKWKPVKGALRYEVYRSASKKGKFQKIAAVQEANSYRDMNRKAGKTYYYKVRAISNGIGGSNYSAYSMIKES